MGICNVTQEHPATVTAPYKHREVGAAHHSPRERCPVPSTAPLTQEAVVGAACPPDAGISPQCDNAALSTAGLALSSALQASAAGASALGRGGDGAGPELMQCQREPGPADAVPLSTQDHDKQDKRWGETAAIGRARRSGPHPALAPPVSLP